MIASPVNGLYENDNATIHNSRLLGEVSVRTVVFQHSTGEQVSLYRLISENMCAIKHICRFVSSLISPIKLNKRIKQEASLDAVYFIIILLIF